MDKKTRLFLNIFFLIGDITIPIAALYIPFWLKITDGWLFFGLYFFPQLFWAAIRGDLDSMLFDTPNQATIAIIFNKFIHFCVNFIRKFFI